MFTLEMFCMRFMTDIFTLLAEESTLPGVATGDVNLPPQLQRERLILWFRLVVLAEQSSANWRAGCGQDRDRGGDRAAYRSWPRPRVSEAHEVSECQKGYHVDSFVMLWVTDRCDAV